MNMNDLSFKEVSKMGNREFYLKARDILEVFDFKKACLLNEFLKNDIKDGTK